MNFKEMVQNVYPEAVYQRSTANGFKQRKYKVSGIKIADGKWLIFKMDYYKVSEENLWEWAWLRIQKRMLKKLMS